VSPVKSESDWVVHASRVLPPFRLGLSASRRNNLFKVREDETSSPARETRALPGSLCDTQFPKSATSHCADQPRDTATVYIAA